MANEKRLIDANALCEFFQERYEYLRNASERQLPNGNVEIDLEIQCGAIIAKEFLDKAKVAPTENGLEVVHARWRKGKLNYITLSRGNHICSNCRSATGIVEFNYCPNCGAKMDGERKDNDY